MLAIPSGGDLTGDDLINAADLAGADTDSAVPEPTSLMLLGLGLLGLLDRGRRVSA